MRRAPFFLVGLLALTGCKGKTVCGPYEAMNLPGVTKIDRCDAEPTSDYGIGGETTASGADFVKAIAASGFELGRDGDGTADAQRTMVYFRKGGATYFMFTDLKPRPGGDNFFSITPKNGAPKTWLPETEWQRLSTTRADRQALIDRLGAARGFLDANPKAPATCDGALGSADPEIVKAPTSVIVNLDSRDFKGRSAGRGPGLFTEAVLDEQEEASAKVSKLVAARAEVDRIAARRVVPVLVVTEYQPLKGTSPPKAGDRVEFVTGGEAKFDVAVVDLEKRQVLCRSKGEASLIDKSKAPPKGAPTLERASGQKVTMWLEGVKKTDLDSEIASAAKTELAKMSPVFAH